MKFNQKTEAFNHEIAERVQKDILEEIFKAAKFPRIQIARKVFKPLLLTVTQRFSIFIAEFDMIVKENGFIFAAQQALLRLCEKGNSIGQENIPQQGPLIIASNHPGTYDGLAIISHLPRNDFKLIVSGIPFFRNLPNASKYLIFATHNVSDRMEVIRKSIRHLQEGGALLIFPSGRLDPDPSIFSDADEGFNKWSRSIEVIMGKVPEAKLILAITSGILSREFINHPFTRLFKNDHERRRIMEFMQVIKQMIREKPVELHPKVSFSKPFSLKNKDTSPDNQAFRYIQEMALQQLGFHMLRFYPDLQK